MGRYRSRSRSRSRSYSPVVRRKRYDDTRDRHNGGYLRDPPPTGLLVRNISLDAREPRGFGFVKFRYAEDAAEAKHQLNRTVIGGREIRVVFAEENRKTPQEMRRLSRVSSRGSYGSHSLSRSPRRQYSSYSCSPYPARRDSRDRRARDDYYSTCRARSISRSVSPCNERNCMSNHMSPRRSRSISRSLSPRYERDYELVCRSPNQNGGSPHDEYARSRSQSPRWNARSHSRSLSRSYSPR